ncbi:uncharacterized protein LOC121854761 isoform X1 [Homarus americanus]|nr:uncharacterized protein LOC121854761 isoform X1 [Homarus americanus]
MNSNGSGERARPTVVLGEATTVRAVPLVGPPYLRRGAQVCGRSVGRTCIFLLITFGVASVMIGVVLFTADLQMVTGFWAVGTVLMLLGVVLIAVFLTLCCSARRTFNALPVDHPDRAKCYRPVAVPSRSSSTYQLLPMRQTPTYALSAPSGQTLGYATTPRGQSVGHPVSSKGETVGYPTLKGHTVGYATTPRGRSVVHPSPDGPTLGYSTLPGGRPIAYSSPRGGQTLGIPESPRGQPAGYLLPHGRQQRDGYSALPGDKPLGYHTPRGGRPYGYLSSPGGQAFGYSTLPGGQIGYRPSAGDHLIGYQGPAEAQVPFNGQVSTTNSSPVGRRVSPSPRAYTQSDDPPPYSTVVDPFTP